MSAFLSLFARTAVGLLNMSFCRVFAVRDRKPPVLLINPNCSIAWIRLCLCLDNQDWHVSWITMVGNCFQFFCLPQSFRYLLQQLIAVSSWACNRLELLTWHSGPQFTLSGDLIHVITVLQELVQEHTRIKHCWYCIYVTMTYNETKNYHKNGWLVYNPSVYMFIASAITVLPHFVFL